MNCMVAQSGGPTVAINASLAGLLRANQESKAYSKVYGAVNGILGVLNENFCDLTDQMKTIPDFIERLIHTPAMYLGSCRYGMVGFSVGNFGYAGTGWIGIGGGANQFRDFWQYDPGSNSWLQKADFGGSGRYSAVGFSIGSKGYVGLGYSPIKNDFWEYDPIGDSWIQMANFPSNRLAAVGFGIGAKGYVGTGYDNNNNSYRDFYEFDPMANSWTVKSDVPGLFRRGAVGFSVGFTGFVGMGYNDTTYLTDYLSYEPGNTSLH